jgi:hypothetical protein
MVVFRLHYDNTGEVIMKFGRWIPGAIGAFLLAALAGCGGGGGSSGADTGTLRVALTDAPACGYDAVNVTIQKVRVHKSSTASDTDAGWSEIVLSPAKRVDLLGLQNGVLAELGQTPLPTGKYTQLRLVLGTNGGTTPLANSVVPSGGSETALTTPSGQQTGLKMNIDMDVGANQMIDLVLDFDACKSVVRAGASGQYLLKPVVSVIPRFISGVSGFVGAVEANGNTLITLQQAGVVVKATAPDSSGAFLLQPVAPGTYDVVITAPGQATEVITDVVVSADTVTPLGTAAAPLNPTASASGTAAGTVTTATAPIDANLRVLQTLSGGHTIEVASGFVNSTTGAYSFALPVGAPLVAPYAATLTFTADAAVAGKYSLQAISGGVTKSAGPITLTSGTTVTTNFTFP